MNTAGRFFALFRADCIALLFAAGVTLMIPLQAEAQSLSEQYQAPQGSSTPAARSDSKGQSTPESVDQLAVFMAENLYQELILSQWQRQSMEICGEPSIPGPLRHVGLSIYEDVRFKNGKPFSGVWTDRYRANACGRERQFNFLFTAQDGKVVIRHMLPGRTLTPPRLQADALKAALPGLIQRHKECVTLIAVDSELERTPQSINDPWSEIWVFEACGKLAATRVNFTPDGQGGTFFRVE